MFGIEEISCSDTSPTVAILYIDKPMKSAIEEVLDSDLSKTYDKQLFQNKSQKLYDLVYEYASRGLKWVS